MADTAMQSEEKHEQEAELAGASARIQPHASADEDVERAAAGACPPLPAAQPCICGKQGAHLASRARARAQQQDDAKAATLVWRSLGWMDRLLSLFIVLAMIVGVLIGVYVEDVQAKLGSAGSLKGVELPLVLGLVIMMWPILTKVQYERLPHIFKARQIWSHILLSLLLNWLLGPFLMLALSWATLPDLPSYRTGIIMVGLARCIAMVMIWCDLAKGDTTSCALLVILNSILQIILYAPYSLFFVRVISRVDSFALQYDETAIAVLIYLGIPLCAGCATRLLLLSTLGRNTMEQKFLPYFGPLSLVALLYTIIIIFASQARRILDNLGPTFRTFVPLILYFTIMWTGTFLFVWTLNRRSRKRRRAGAAAAAVAYSKEQELTQEQEREDGKAERSDSAWDYKMAVVQAFTAASNNFELAIAICVSIFGAGSDEALAATIGPLVEVPVLLLLSWVALYLGNRLAWSH